MTIVLMVLFIAVWIWAWQPRLRAGFEATARLAVDDQMPEGEAIASTPSRTNA
ncbi:MULTISPECIES: cbb3-type cytochrome oxidase subunit 3 [Thermomonas]|uniref:cbb3-type cytochrome oxidase subunit 3 n=1 Tax=Thermomonas TaxID=141948 RepID=UPI001CBF06F9|nr:cbb3-type cytochrome c oxidase subunit 3 [Thermomonas beijingensis]HQQ58587.1 cbb3-type cytochrome c oxidase subunit 3 [Thermomonas sp.]